MRRGDSLVQRNSHRFVSSPFLLSNQLSGTGEASVAYCPTRGVTVAMLDLFQGS